MSLQPKNKSSKQRTESKLRISTAPSTPSNAKWAMDFVQGHLATGKTIRVLTVVDVYSRFSPAIDLRFNYRAEDVLAALERVCTQTGYPRTIRVDLGLEFVSLDLRQWAHTKGVTLEFSRPNETTANTVHEAFSGHLRRECLSVHRFVTLAEAREKVRGWLTHYNNVRPHRAIGNRVPISLQNAEVAAGRASGARPEAPCRLANGAGQLGGPRGSRWRAIGTTH